MTSPPIDRPASDRAGRVRVALEESILPPLVALVIAAVVGDVLIIVFGQSPGDVYRQLLEGTWGNAYGFGQVIYKATTLTFTGLAPATKYLGSVAYGGTAGMPNPTIVRVTTP